MSVVQVASMAGQLRVVPGAPLPRSLSSSRQDWAARVGAGQSVTLMPGLMASLFSLCGNAHRVCAQLAIDAARPDHPAGAQPDIGERLRLETAQEHVRRIGLDWPRLLGTDRAETAPGLATCPALRHTGDAVWPALREWLQQHWLHMDPAAWLANWLSGAGDWLHAWSQQHSSWLAGRLRAARSADMPDLALNRAHALQAHASLEHLQTLGASIDREDGIALQPTWQHHTAHTGNWARLSTPADQPALSPWALLGSRIAELVRLCLPEGAHWLRWGALNAQPGQGIGWVEMARGLLVHQVTLSDDGTTAQRCRVLAPTEWNFHPRGEVAQRLSAMDPTSPLLLPQVGLLMAAFDPCVPFELVPQNMPEVTHA